MKLKINLFAPLLTAALLTAQLAIAETQPVTVTVADDGASAELAPRFMGLSYEMSMLLPKEGRYYIDKNDQALLNTFKTLNVKSLRVGANAVDDPRIEYSAFSTRLMRRRTGLCSVPTLRRLSSRSRVSTAL